MMEARHRISFRIVHPTADTTCLADAFEWDPVVSWVLGEPGKLPSGRPWGGPRKQSYWIASDFDESGKFGIHFSDLIVWAEKHRSVIVELVRSGGELHFWLRLPGDCDFGDVVPADQLRRMAALGIGLMLEVYPDFR